MTAVAITDPSEEIIGKIKKDASAQVPTNQVDLLNHFIAIYYGNVSVEDLKARSLNDLAGMAVSHWKLLCEGQLLKKDQREIKIFNPREKEDGWQSTHTVIQLVTQDAPFLVDSLCIALSRLGLNIHLIIHCGGLKVRYDSQQQITEVLPHTHQQESDIISVAPICIEIDRQNKPETLENIKGILNEVLNDVRVAVEDWKPMELKLYAALKEIESNPNIPLEPKEIEETRAFLEWFVMHFTFLGFRQYDLITKDGEKMMSIVHGSSLGVLRDDSHSKQLRTPATSAGYAFLGMPTDAQDVALANQILVFFQTNTKATVHRDAYSNCLSILRFDMKGRVIGEYRFVGLYASRAYYDNIRNIPIIREKVKYILERSDLPERGYGLRKLLHILETFPRDDLFEGHKEELFRLAMDILRMQERKKIRLFVRRDAFNRYISCLIYIPKDNFNTELLNKMQSILAKHFNAIEVSLNGIFFQGVLLARIHYIVRIDPKQKVDYDLKAIEMKLSEVGRSWKDDLCHYVFEAFGEEEGNQLIEKYRYAFPASYRDSFSPQVAIRDIAHIEKLSSQHPLEMTFYRPEGVHPSRIHFKLFHLECIIPLSDAMPMLENLGLRVISEEPYQIRFANDQSVWVNEFIMEYPMESLLDMELSRMLFQEAFFNVWAKNAESDDFNQLTLSAQLSWREVMVLRAYAKLLRQTGFTFTQPYIESAFNNNPGLAKLLIELFILKFDPEKQILFKEGYTLLTNKITQALENVASLDEDRILRQYLKLIQATVRTNYFQKLPDGSYKPYLSLKLESKKIPDLPKPEPLYDLFVYSPRFEGIHLRTSKVARGGLRWSDRFEDFRTEVLGLVKAQQVKNSVIVPSGSKGGFVCKQMPEGATRDEILAEGIACYKGFISGMLDISDNLKNNQLVHPANTVIYDGEDPYLVVAADKGTATFSDIANGISTLYDFWLGDAFASGGSQGYDHKAMGITARGAWISVERHFQEMGLNPQTQDFTVVGIGDMAGDVFGNGMLLSEHIKLVAAFNHMHIFLDPNPNAQVSYQERKRMFELPKSTWKDYNPDLISAGGGVFDRSAKSIKISPEVKMLLSIEEDYLEPNELIRLILMAPVDLLWNGGIGTYVKARSEKNADAGDRANDSLRINADELKALSIGEGGNLGFTQLARIEFELHGGRVNTDFVDNCGGVNCSDHEVNIKILLNSIVKAGGMTEQARNVLLAQMTEEVAALVLRNNYQQNRTLSIAKSQAMDYYSLYKGFMEYAEGIGKLDREIEFLPDEKALDNRKLANASLTRPELATLAAYSRILLKEAILGSNLIQAHPYLEKYLYEAFPKPLREKYFEELKKHPLYREIIATQLSNSLLSDMGPIFIYQLSEEFNQPAEKIVPAYVIAKHVFQMDHFWSEIDALDNKMDAQVQIQMAVELVSLVRRATRWFLWNQAQYMDIQETIALFSAGVAKLYEVLPDFLMTRSLIQFEQQRDQLIAANVPETLARKIACMRFMDVVPNIIEIALKQGEEVTEVASVFFQLSNRLDLFWLQEQINLYPVDGHWTVLAKSALKGDLDQLQRNLITAVLHVKTKTQKAGARMEAWLEHHKVCIGRWEKMLTTLEGKEEKDPAILFVVLRELGALAH